MISRAEWSVSGTARPPVLGPVPVVMIHHTASREVFEPAQERAAMQSWEAQHQAWNPPAISIGYNWVVFPSGCVYEGRGWGAQGAHAGNREINRTSVGIAYAGDCEQAPPTDAAMVSIRNLIAEGLRLGHIQPDATIVGHRDHRATLCPGKYLYDRLDRLDPRGTPVPEAARVVPPAAVVPAPSLLASWLAWFRRTLTP